VLFEKLPSERLVKLLLLSNTSSQMTTFGWKCQPLPAKINLFLKKYRPLPATINVFPPDAFQVPPDAFQVPPDASQVPPDVSEMPPDVSRCYQMPPDTSTGGNKYRFGIIFNVFGTFIRSNPFESLTKNDATGGAHLFRPTTDFCYGIKHRF